MAIDLLETGLVEAAMPVADVSMPLSLLHRSGVSKGVVLVVMMGHSMQ